MPRFSIKTMMVYMSFIAVGLAALRNANELWAGTIVVLTVGMLGTCVFSVHHGQTKMRNWWFGFALFGCGYVLIAFGPLFSELKSLLPSSQLCAYLHEWSLPSTESISTDQLEANYNAYDTFLKESQLTRSAIENYEAAREQIKAQLIARGSPLTQGMQLSPLEQRRHLLLGLLTGLENVKAFDTVAHGLSALLAGLIGAVISSRINPRAIPNAQSD